METVRSGDLIDVGDEEKRISERFSAARGAMVMTGDGDELTLITAEKDRIRTINLDIFASSGKLTTNGRRITLLDWSGRSVGRMSSHRWSVGLLIRT